MGNPRRPAPADYGECYEQYIGLIRRWAHQQGITPGRVEESSQEVFVRFMERDRLHDFVEGRYYQDPMGVLHRSWFYNFLFGFVSLALRNQRDIQTRQFAREASVEAMLETADGEVLDRLVLEDVYDEVEETVSFEETVRSIATALPDPLTPLFRAIVSQVHSTGKLDRKLIRERLGISSSVLRRQMLELREVCASVGFAPEVFA